MLASSAIRTIRTIAALTCQSPRHPSAVMVNGAAIIMTNVPNEKYVLAIVSEIRMLRALLADITRGVPATTTRI